MPTGMAWRRLMHHVGRNCSTSVWPAAVGRARRAQSGYTVLKEVENQWYISFVVIDSGIGLVFTGSWESVHNSFVGGNQPRKAKGEATVHRLPYTTTGKRSWDVAAKKLICDNSDHWCSPLLEQQKRRAPALYI